MNSYIFASVGSWHKKIYQEKTRSLPGKWTYVGEPKELTLDKLESIKPKYIFFPHWRWKVPDEIVNNYDCICFHETDLPFGRGGTPIQNLILRGFKETVISAIKMTPELDAGPIYIKRRLSLKGAAQNIYTRSARTVFRMIKEIIEKNIAPRAQNGRVTFFKRRTPSQSKIPKNVEMLEQLYDFIRMLDAEGYPHAFIESGRFRIEFTRARLHEDFLNAQVNIAFT